MNKAMYLKNYISSLSWNYSRNRSFSYDDHLIWSFQQIKKKAFESEFNINSQLEKKKKKGKVLESF